MTDTERGGGTEEESPAGHDDTIACLLALAGPRPPVPDDVTARVKAAVQVHWQQQLAGRNPWLRRSLVALAAVAVVVLAVGTSLWYASSNRTRPEGPSAISSASVAEVVTAAGEGATLVVPGAERPVSLTKGGAVAAGAMITTPSSARVALLAESGVSVRLDVSTRVRLMTASELVLEAGAVYVDNPSQGAARVRIDVRTPMGTASDVGTQFETRVDARGLRVRVREGTVVVRRNATTETARPGEELRVHPTGAVERRTLSAHDPEWAWVVEMAPTFAIEGRRLGEFLAWTARETGWRVEFGDARLARSAPGFVLHGSIEGLTPAAAVEAVLPTCGLVHRVRDGALLVEEASRKGP